MEGDKKHTAALVQATAAPWASQVQLLLISGLHLALEQLNWERRRTRGDVYQQLSNRTALISIELVYGSYLPCPETRHRETQNAKNPFGYIYFIFIFFLI